MKLWSQTAVTLISLKVKILKSIECVYLNAIYIGFGESPKAPGPVGLSPTRFPSKEKYKAGWPPPPFKHPLGHLAWILQDQEDHCNCKLIKLVDLGKESPKLISFLIAGRKWRDTLYCIVYIFRVLNQKKYTYILKRQVLGLGMAFSGSARVLAS